jgi:glycosyltransferase involved in cell wall biosynthesis
MSKLAVVLISKNQDWSIPRLIESVLGQTAHLESVEIVLIDSASTDKTVEVAGAYPIQIVRLHADQRLTAAAGRHTGLQQTSAELVLFLDGDMQLCPGWLDRALQLFSERPDVAVVTGKVIDVPTHANLDLNALTVAQGDGAVTSIQYTGGAAMYRRSVLEQVGSFNPYLYSDEEPDLCIRIRHTGYQIVRIQAPLAYHYSDPRKQIPTLIARWRRNLYLGTGQNIRYHLGTPHLWPYVRERGYGFVPGLGVVAGLVSLGWSLRSGQWLWFNLWAFLLASLIVLQAGRKRSVSKALASVLERLLIFDGMLRGFLLPRRSSATDPIRFDRG